jgi:hypothetical protein
MFRFTIRDVLWLMVVVGMAIAWWWDSFRLERERSAFREAEATFAIEHQIDFEIRDNNVTIRKK